MPLPLRATAKLIISDPGSSIAVVRNAASTHHRLVECDLSERDDPTMLVAGIDTQLGDQPLNLVVVLSD